MSLFSKLKDEIDNTQVLVFAGGKAKRMGLIYSLSLYWKFVVVRYLISALATTGIAVLKTLFYW